MPRFLIDCLTGVAGCLFVLALASADCLAQTVIPPDTAPTALRDTVARPPADTTARAAPQSPAVAPEPVDSVRAAACIGGGSIAENLLLVQFSLGTEPKVVEALAREVGGTLPGTDGLGTYYLQVAAGTPAGLNALADRVIQHPAVLSVGAVDCPPPATLPAAAAMPTSPADTSARQ
jgi:hypothetical protein